MPENEFEKQVRQTMEAFRLQPSEPVWPEIERQIREKKRRRLVFLIPLLAGLVLLGYVGYRGFPGKQNKLSAVKQNTVHPYSIEKRISSGSQSNLPAEKAQKVLPFTRKLSDEAAKASTPEEHSRIDRDKHNQAVNQIQNYTSIADEPETLNNQQSAVAEKPASDNNIKTGLINGPVEMFANPDEQPATRKRVTSKVALVRMFQEVNGKMQLQESVMNLHFAEQIPSNEETISYRKKLSWSFDVSSGIANRSSRSAGFFPADHSSHNSGQTVTSGMNGFAITQPSGVNAGLGLKTGVAVKKNLSAKLAIRAGLRYVYLSDRINVGNTVYSNFRANNGISYNVAVQPYSAGFQARQYNNQYHLIELPLTLQFAFNNRSRYPLVWDVGFSVSHLAATNALLYDGSNGGFYYEGKNMLKKNQVSFLTGFSISFGSKQRQVWYIGPELSLGLTPYLKNVYNKQVYPLYGGLKLSYGLGNITKN